MDKNIMNNEFKSLNKNDVINLNDKNDDLMIGYHTFQVEDFMYKLVNHFCTTKELNSKWLEGLDSEVLTSSTGWRKEKIRLNIEFCPDELESPLDNIRKTINEQRNPRIISYFYNLQEINFLA